MQKSLILLILVFTTGCMPSARSESNPSTPTTVIVAPTRFVPTWKNPIHLKYGEKVILTDGFQITFSAIVEDTRCLKTENSCSQEGNAKIRLMIQYSSGMESEFLLNTYPKFTSGWINGHVIELKEIKPDLPVTSPSEIMNYEIWIMILLI
jgi:hypothetical protein